MNSSQQNLDGRIHFLEGERNKLIRKLEREAIDYRSEKQEFDRKEAQFKSDKEAIEFQLEENKVLIDYYKKLKENPSWRKNEKEI